MSRDDTDLESEAPDDLRSILEAAVEASGTAPASEDVDSDPAPRARRPDGKFTKPEEGAAEEAPAVEAEKAETPPEEAQKPETKGIEPPQHWSEADKAKFKAMPLEAQSWVIDRDKAMTADYTKKTTEIAAFKREYGPVAEMFAPHEAALRQSGYTPATLIKAWADVEQQLMSGKAVDVLVDIASKYKADKAELARRLGFGVQAAPGVETPPQPQGQTAAPIPPELQAKLQTYDQFIAQQQMERQQEAANRQREEANRVMSTIDQFRDAKDATGNLLHPHFAAVEDAMTRLAIAARTSGQPVPSLDELYDQAVWANTSTRAQVLEAQRAAEEAQRKAAEAERVKEARAKAERAKRAASSVTGSPSSGQSGARSGDGERTLREILQANYEELTAA